MFRIVRTRAVLIPQIDCGMCSELVLSHRTGFPQYLKEKGAVKEKHGQNFHVLPRKKMFKEIFPA